MSKLTSPSRTDLSEALSSKILELILLPTEECNFRCIYCYEDHVPGRMSNATVAGIKRLIERRMDDLQFLRLSWFGGEPLIAADILFEIGEFANKQCDARGVILAGDVTTNGFMLAPATMSRLVAAKHQQFFVSLAGAREVHDRLRPLVSGKGTFDRIWRNLTELRDSSLDFTIDLRLHFGPDIIPCEALCREVNDAFGDDGRFTVSLQRIADLGGANTGTFDTVAPEDARAIVWHLASLLPDVQVSNLYPKKHPICCAARPNNMIIRTDGRLSRCACQLNDHRNFVGSIDADGHLALDQKQLNPWFKGYNSFDGNMLACPVNTVPREAWPEAAPTGLIPVERLVGQRSTSTVVRAS